jgi:hypothetical protein
MRRKGIDISCCSLLFQNNFRGFSATGEGAGWRLDSRRYFSTRHLFDKLCVIPWCFSDEHRLATRTSRVFGDVKFVHRCGFSTGSVEWFGALVAHAFASLEGILAVSGQIDLLRRLFGSFVKQ